MPVSYLNQTVLEAAKERIRYLFNEFPNVIVGISGGKDSTVVFNLCLEIAEEMNRLPLHTVWIDQEAEWQGTVDYVRDIMYDKRVKPVWLQVPFKMTNNASTTERFVSVWNPDLPPEQYIHPKDPIAYHENIFGKDRFHDMFNGVVQTLFKGQKACLIGGVRTEETPKRFIVLTSGSPTYKHITWGKIINKKTEQFVFYPIYDWRVTDVWKYIHDNKVPYNRIYDEMYRHGVPVKDMRISNLHHETAVQNILLVQEIEPQTWNKLADRIAGANTIKHIKKNAFQCPTELPPMFNDWVDYTEYLADKLIPNHELKSKFHEIVGRKLKIVTDERVKTDFLKVAINTILCSDFDFTKITNFFATRHLRAYIQAKNGLATIDDVQYAKYLTTEQIHDIISRHTNRTKGTDSGN
jgi:predicted phosphoadenosine phosphosulfate sulfurtransferase